MNKPLFIQKIIDPLILFLSDIAIYYNYDIHSFIH